MIYVTSDIHGEYELFVKLLEKIGFCDDDVMYVCGDLIDKGDKPIKLVQYVKNKPNVKCILGNHEQAFLNYYHSQLASGDFESYDKLLGLLEEYLEGDKGLDWDTVDFIESLPYYIEEEKFICVHAGLPIDGNGKAVHPKHADARQLVFDRNFKNPKAKITTDKCVFFGHTPTMFVADSTNIRAYLVKGVKKAESISDFSRIHIDTGVYQSGVLGCFCVDLLRAFYVRRS